MSNIIEPHRDVLAHLSELLAQARKDASVAVDRADALAELLSEADATAAGQNQYMLTIEQLMDQDELTRAKLTALIDRGIPMDKDDTE